MSNARIIQKIYDVHESVHCHIPEGKEVEVLEALGIHDFTDPIKIFEYHYRICRNCKRVEYKDKIWMLSAFNDVNMRVDSPESWRAFRDKAFEMGVTL